MASAARDPSQPSGDRVSAGRRRSPVEQTPEAAASQVVSPEAVPGGQASEGAEVERRGSEVSGQLSVSHVIGRGAKPWVEFFRKS